MYVCMYVCMYACMYMYLYASTLRCEISDFLALLVHKSANTDAEALCQQLVKQVSSKSAARVHILTQKRYAGSRLRTTLLRSVLTCFTSC
jgi:hypothetical protein